MTTILETRRTRLREFSESDLDVLAAMMADKEQMRFPQPRTREETHVWIKENLEFYEKHGFGFWLMESVEDAHFLGYCGIRPGWWQRVEDTEEGTHAMPIEGLGDIEMGWHTKKQFWGQGLATDAATACRDLAFSRFAIPRLVATIDPDNAPSVRVAQKVGMQLEKETVLHGWPCVVYSLERPVLE